MAEKHMRKVVKLPGHLLVSDYFLIALLFLLTSGICAFLSRHGSHLGFVDVAHDGYQLRTALDVRNGHALFKNTFTQYGVLSELLNATALSIFGMYLLSLKYLTALAYGFASIILFGTTRFLGASQAVASAIVIFWLASAPFYMHGIMVSPHQWAVIIQLFSLVALLKSFDKPDLRLPLLLGVLTGALFLAKQNMGLYQFFMLSLVITLHSWIFRSGGSHTLSRLISFLVGFSSILLPLLLWLLYAGAIDDWYKQTILFPKELYIEFGWERYYSGQVRYRLSEYLGVELRDYIPRSVSLALLSFYGTAAEPYWMYTRIILLALCLLHFLWGNRRFGIAGGALLLASSLGNFPSWSYMHQWWTLAVVLPLVPVLLLQPLRGAPPLQWRTSSSWQFANLVRIVRTLSVPSRLQFVLSILFVYTAYKIIEPNIAQSTRERVASYSVQPCVTIEGLPALRGICTTAGFGENLKSIVGLLNKARSGNSERPVVSIETTVGYLTSPMTLLVVAAMPKNASPHPVLWDAPVLSETLYSNRRQALVARNSILVDFALTGVIRKVRGYNAWGFVPDQTYWKDGGWVIYLPNGDSIEMPGNFSVPPQIPTGLGERVGPYFRGKGLRVSDGWYMNEDGLELRADSAAWFVKCLDVGERNGDQVLVVINAQTPGKENILPQRRELVANINGSPIVFSVQPLGAATSKQSRSSREIVLAGKLSWSALCRSGQFDVQFDRRGWQEAFGKRSLTVRFLELRRPEYSQ